MNRPKFIVSLAMFNVAIFVITVLFLPKKKSFSWTTGDPVSHFVNSRDEWTIAFGMLFATALISWGVYTLVDGLPGPYEKSGERS